MILLQTQKRFRQVADLSGAAEITLVTFPSRLSAEGALNELLRYSHKLRRTYPDLQSDFTVVGIQHLPEEIDEAVLWSVGLIPIEAMCDQVDLDLAEWADLGRMGPNTWDDELRAQAGLPPLGEAPAAEAAA